MSTTSTIHDEPESTSPLLQQYRSSLASFASSPSAFQLLKTIPAPDTPNESPPKTLYILDSSFNPPTAAHMRIAASALGHDPKCKPPKRLLLLLVTEDPLKPYMPPTLEHRLTMMTLFAHDLQLHLKNATYTPKVTTIDIGVIKKPYFIDKPKAITDSGVYPPSTEQVYLAGFDVVLKLFNPQLNPPHYTLAPLSPFLNNHRLRIAQRPDDQWGTKQDQLAYFAALARGEKEDIGAKREWAEQIDFVDDKTQGETSISSSSARLLAAAGSHDGLETQVTPAVRDWIISNSLYR